ncbi:hypothetical protein K8M07_01310 [Schnuerera sp. xch1]|uniref:hypothetical protein n=1 Tax=Schnuerera sp. xch1 TaxID=2874283 RepID=UPI001CBC70EC|nr:hypothetical protein [Schnuerera sp. xch1]MBZ2173891.1 hypothetical protein [Schnuerera sp. xch1]
MKINGFINFMRLYIDNKEEFLKEGSLILGEILETNDELALIDIKGLGTVKAITENNLKNYIGKELTFIIKSLSHNRMELKPIFNNTGNDTSAGAMKKKEKYLGDILKEFHIKDDFITKEFLNNLIKYNVQINKENLSNGIGILDKLEHLLDIKEDEVAILANRTNQILNIDKEDIRNIIIKKDEGISKNNITDILKEHINILQKKEIDRNLIKLAAFFIKHNIKPTLNNIRFITELNEEPMTFSKDYEMLKSFINNKFTNENKNIIIDIESFNNLIEENEINYKESLEKILNYIRENKVNMDSSVNNSVEEFMNKIEFLKEMNRELVFFYLPLNLENDLYNGAITLLKKRKRKSGFTGNTNIFINLTTRNLGNIKISCQALNLDIKVKFINMKDEDINLFKSKEDELKYLVKSTGYRIDSIEYSFKNNEDILDSLIINQKPLYYLDVQV